MLRTVRNYTLAGMRGDLYSYFAFIFCIIYEHKIQWHPERDWCCKNFYKLSQNSKQETAGQ